MYVGMYEMIYVSLYKSYVDDLRDVMHEKHMLHELYGKYEL